MERPLEPEPEPELVADPELVAEPELVKEPEPEPELVAEPEPELATEPEPEAAAELRWLHVRWLYGPPVVIEEHRNFVVRAEAAEDDEGRSFNVSVERPAEGGRSRRKRGRPRASGESSFTLSRCACCPHPLICFCGRMLAQSVKLSSLLSWWAWAYTVPSHSVLVKSANDGRSSTVEIPYSDIFAVARRELGLFQLTAVQSVAAAAALGSIPAGEAGGTTGLRPQTATFDFWGEPDAVGEVCRCLGNLVEDRRYSSVVDQEIGAECLAQGLLTTQYGVLF
eukprot:COSAG02_NODE_1764_length_11026_cov_4.823465_6_plen_281_part_00